LTGDNYWHKNSPVSRTRMIKKSAAKQAGFQAFRFIMNLSVHLLQVHSPLREFSAESI